MGRTSRAVLFDRDGTLIVDVPENRDAANVTPMPQARECVKLLRSRGWRIGIVTNQPQNLSDRALLAAINRRVDELFGRFDGWFVCRHAPDRECDCRKPKPGLILRAARSFGIEPSQCVVVGDIGADVEAARAAGARSVLVPTPITRPSETESAPVVAPDLATATDMILRGEV